MQIPTRDHVIVLHGIWMRGIAMLPLARRLRAAGFTVDTPDYPSVVGSWSDSASRLAEHWRGHAGRKVHVVGHSLGGMLALHVAAKHEDLPDGRIVCLGSPLKGSSAAGRMRGLPGGHWLMGQSAEILRAGLDPWRGQRAVGVVAGSTPIGLGSVLGVLKSPHDGTVSVDETRLEGITEHRVVSFTHSGLAFSGDVAEMTACFLRDGHFPDEAAP
ncbi:MAG TPA: alpha/beta hydrolase [Dokdonella sp.]|uniref:esterase/lipase family protein n=1 Tax=Dokdonella sp. TaxID=2291710 RepID=UPI002D802852|nr:alpha/beta hydrolase [Dokdonella sp.]HET9032038.1 alpha/beta hydrolase [Dokdonella sp.]